MRKEKGTFTVRWQIDDQDSYSLASIVQDVLKTINIQELQLFMDVDNGCNKI